MTTKIDTEDKFNIVIRAAYDTVTEFQLVVNWQRVATGEREARIVVTTSRSDAEKVASTGQGFGLKLMIGKNLIKDLAAQVHFAIVGKNNGRETFVHEKSSF